MNLPDLIDVNLNLNDGSKLELFNPKLKEKKGYIYIIGYINNKDFLNPNELRKKLDDKRIRTNEDYISISCLTSMNREIKISNVTYSYIKYPSLKIKLICHGELIEEVYRYPVDNIKKVNNINSISIEGLELAHTSFTQTESKRVILNETHSLGVNSKRDYSVYKISFLNDQEKINLNLSFIQSPQSDRIINVNIEGDEQLNLKTYIKIKHQLIGFLSFPSGNNLTIREENFCENSIIYRKLFSLKNSKKQNHPDYILINKHTDQKNVFEEYLKCFDNYLVMDKYFDLTSIIYLFNEAKKGSLESRVFIMLIVIEKLASKFLSSPFNTNPNNHIIDSEIFNSLIKNTKNTFENDFKNIKVNDFNILNSRLGSINQKTKTDRKIYDLLEFAEIELTSEIEYLFPMIRNLAIHTGEVDHPSSNALINYKTLIKLINDLIANIIQYKGYRLFERQEEANIIDIKNNYKINIDDYR